jgi:acetyl-CoA C-acetyltransferase
VNNVAKVGTPLNKLGDNEAVIVSVARTPLGRAFKGSLIGNRPDDLLALVIAEAVKRVPALDKSEIEDVIVGCGFPQGESGMNVARVAALLAGLPNEVPGVTVNRFCSSGLVAITLAAQQIALGLGDVYVAGGVETSSRVVPQDFVPNPRFKGEEGLPNVYIAMGQTAENVARRFGVSREDQDFLAYKSQQKASKAIADGLFDAEIVPVTTPEGKVISRDDGPRPETTVEVLSNLKPVFREDGTVTAGNSCPLNDGAAAVVLMSLGKARALGVTPLARLVTMAVAGIEPEIMGVGPIRAVPKALARAGLTIEDIDIVELNEAFASQVIEVCRQVKVDIDKQLNPKGGAIALGHPFGCTGARIMSTLVTGLKQFDKQIGLETMCVGGGQGYAAIVERLN